MRSSGSVLYLYFIFICFFMGCEATATKPCNLSRNVFNSTWGVIIDGSSGSNYTCEWLIEANNSRQFITLSFRTMGTECSYDYLFVYDGNSFKAPLLGSFSGKTEPQQVIAASGAMLILLYSDTNYVLDGFRAEFSVTDCRNNCSQHGTCVSHVCVCDEDWGGRDCSYKLCPENCGEAHGRGKCNKNQCSCKPGYSGQACSLHRGDTLGNKWHWLSHAEKGLSPRAAHTAIYDNVTDALYVFGGYDLNRVLGDLSIYRFDCSCWVDKYGNELDQPDAEEALDSDHIAAVLQHVGMEKVEHSSIPSKSSFFRQFLFTIPDNSTFSIHQHEGTENPNSHIPSAGIVESILRHLRSRKDTNIQIAEDNQPEDEERSWLNKQLMQVTKEPLPESSSDSISTEEPINVGITVEHDTVRSEFESEVNSVDDNDTTTQQPEELEDMPSPRYGHAACKVPGGFVLYGGKLADGSLSDELWLYNISSTQWSLRALSSSVRPPRLTFHTLTLGGKDEDWLYLFGGSTTGGEFLSRLFRLRLEDPETETWSEVYPRGGKELDVRVVAHSTVYHRQTNSLLVYGGVVTGVARISKLSDRMFAFQLDNRHWTEHLYPRAQLRDTYVPRERAFHTSTIIGNYLVVFGGYSHSHSKEEICYDNQMHLYHLSCLTWVSHEILGAAEKTQFYPKQQGVFAHAAAVGWGNTLLIVGGFHGNVNADLLAYTLPPTLATPGTPEGEMFEGEQICSRHRVLMECTANPECGWCSADEICYGRTVGINCTTNLQTTRCPGICPPLGDCHACLIKGAEGGWHECRWSIQLNKCVSPSDQSLYCAGGVCGLVLRLENIDKCPEPCSTFKQCSTCLRHAHCGWCSLDMANSTGQGICSEGSLDSPSSGPSRSTCENLYLQQGLSPTVIDSDALNATLSRDAVGAFSWHFVGCPPENECLNDHHTCDNESEQCVDLVDGFHCVCGQGYSLNKASECVPVCAQGCVRGECVQPGNKCLCEFGYVGANCSIQCQCNGHSNCEGPANLDQCIECHNNTKGAQCEKCKPLFVGDPSHNVPCVPCIEYCNGHTHICINDSFAGYPFPTASAGDLLLDVLEEYLGEGPTTRARCVACQNRTAGDKCDKCITGNFRGSEDAREACRPCECHGHGDVCDPVTGEKCNCQNNTESDESCSSGGKGQQCWMVQCTKCHEAYMGTPTFGHQCYRHMIVDSKFCFDAKELEECKMKPKPLYPGQTVFFVVQPRFMNFDIRVIVDVTQGGVDLFLSPRDDTFVVSLNSSTGAHVIEMDPRFHWRGEEFDDVSNGVPVRLKQLELVPHGGELSLNGSAERLMWSSPQVYVMMEREALGLTTFVTVLQRNTFLVVRNVRDRLVLTLPQDRHDLGMTRFYLALTAASSHDALPRPSYGMIFFRQDQLHINHFVVFSVFFSLFLAVCVVARKAKQAADERRARRRHMVEMLHMPSGHLPQSRYLQLEGEEPVPTAASSHPPQEYPT